MEALKPFKIGTDPATFLDIMGIRDPVTMEIRPIDPKTGKPGTPIAGSEPEGTMVAGMTPQSLRANAERYRQTGQFPPGTGRGRQGPAQKTAIENEAARLDKEEGVGPEERPKRWQKFKAEQIAIQRFKSGPQGNNIRGLDVAVDHLQTVLGLGSELKNGNFVPFNRFAQMIAEQTGQPEPTNFDAAKRIVGSEIIKALGVAGAGTEVERREAGDAFNRARSWPQIEGGVKTVQRLLGGQLRGLRQQFKGATGLDEKSFNDSLLPGTLEFLDQPEKKTDSASLPEAAVKRLKEGVVTTFNNGQKWTLKNGKPQKVE